MDIKRFFQALTILGILFIGLPYLALAVIGSGSIGGGGNYWQLNGSNLAPNETTYRVGVGTTTPAGQFGLEQLGTVHNVFYIGDAGTSTPHFIIDGKGNVGVGTTSPGRKFSIGGALIATGKISFSNLVSCDTIDTDAAGILTCGTDATGSATATSTLHYFDVERLIAKSLTATSTDLTLRTFGTGSVIRAVQSFNASSTAHIEGAFNVAGAATLPGGLTVTCSGCLTDTNVADIALGSGTSGNYVATIADAGNSTVTVTGSGSETAAVTLDVVDVNCSNCIDGTDIAMGSDATGDIIYYNGTDYVRLGIGTRGTILSVTTGAIPGWVSTSTFAHLAANNAFTGTGTTTFTAGLSVGSGGLASSKGLTLTGGVLVSTGSGSSTFAGNVGLSSSRIVVQGTATSSFGDSVNDNNDVKFWGLVKIFKNIIYNIFTDTDGATITLDWQQKVHQVTLGGNRTIAFSNVVPGMTMCLVVIQDATGSRTLTWPSSVHFNGGAPTLQTTGGANDTVCFLSATSTLSVIGYK